MQSSSRRARRDSLVEQRRGADFGFAEAEALGQTLDLIIPETRRGRHWQGAGYGERGAYGCGQSGALLSGLLQAALYPELLRSRFPD